MGLVVVWGDVLILHVVISNFENNAVLLAKSINDRKEPF